MTSLMAWSNPLKRLVDVTGIEPVTPCFQSWTIGYNNSVRFL